MSFDGRVASHEVPGHSRTIPDSEQKFRTLAIIGPPNWGIQSFQSAYCAAPEGRELSRRDSGAPNRSAFRKLWSRHHAG